MRQPGKLSQVYLTKQHRVEEKLAVAGRGRPVVAARSAGRERSPKSLKQAGRK
jgi:hypothetical protein